MAIDLHIRKIDETWVRLEAEKSVLMEVFDAFRFRADGYRYMPTYKMKIWDGFINMFDTRTQTIYRGLIPQIIKFAKDRGYKIEVDDELVPGNEDVDTEAFIDGISVTSKGNKIEAKFHQRFAINYAIKHKRCLLISPTSSGKSLIAYYITRWYLQNESEKVLIVVPTTGLVDQMRGDFNDYSQLNGYDADDDIHEIVGGREKNSEKRIYISTWQSIYKMGKPYFAQFGMIIGDEAHMYQATNIKKILENSTTSQYKIGMTGTLSGAKCHELQLQGLFGKVKKVISTKELMDQGDISKLSIDIINLKYPENVRKETKKLTYPDEMAWLYQHDKRNQFIQNLVETLSGNTLVLFSQVENHCKPMYEMMLKTSKKKLFYVTGDVSGEDRGIIRKEIELEKNAIIFASYGVFSTGVNIINLHNIVFASPSKSMIRVLQSIGRGLRKGSMKNKARLFDISDDLCWKSHENYSFKHAEARTKIYDGEKHPYKWVHVNL